MRKHVAKNSVNRHVSSSEKLSDPVRSPVSGYTYKDSETMHKGSLLEGTMANQVSPGTATDLTIGASREINRD